MIRKLSETVRLVFGALVLAAGTMIASGAAAGDFNPAIQVGPDGMPTQTGRIEWGLWIDPDGCMHWWADGGLEGYMVPRRDPATGRAMCLQKDTCLVENTDTLFATDSARVTPQGRARLEHFFRNSGAFGHAIYGHTDIRASDEYNMRLSERRARAVAEVARSVGAPVDRIDWFGRRMPRATNATAEGMQLNRRVEIVCYRW